MTELPELPDPIKALIAYLQTDDYVAARVDNRVFGGSVDEDENPNMPRCCVVLAPAGGGMIGQTNDFGDVRIDTLCYGSDEAEAWQVYRTVLRAMKLLERETIDGVLLHWARVSAGGATGTDPVTAWPVCVASFQVLAAEIAAG